MAEVVAALPDGDLAVIEADHWIHETRPDAYMVEIRAFLSKL